MKISNSKKMLAKIVAENGGWREEAEWAAQDKRSYSLPSMFWFYTERPKKFELASSWRGQSIGDGVECSELIRNWHQTILSRAEYFHLYPAPDADGWIGWMGGECPVGDDVVVEVKTRDGEIEFDAAYFWNWSHEQGSCIQDRQIVAYRLHNPEQDKPEFCESMMGSIPEPTAKPTIEQLAADYRSAKDYADRKQQEADDAKADANEALRKLEIAGEAIGLLVSPITEKQDPELVIGVQVGDEVECVEPNINRDKHIGRIGTVLEVDDSSTPYLVDLGSEGKIWCHVVKLIRRP